MDLIFKVDPVETIKNFFYENDKIEYNDNIIEKVFIQDEVDNITNLVRENTKKAHYFLSQNKAQQKCRMTLYDGNKNDCLPLTTGVCCWWCRFPFTWSPVGCPLKYYPNLSKDDPKYNIMVQNLKSMNLSTSTTFLFETEGIFCSFPCVLSYIVDENGKGKISKYKDSLNLLTLMYEKIYEEKIIIPNAPSWKMLEAYGGHLKIDEFRSLFGKIKYLETPNVKRPIMYNTSQYYVEI